MRLASLFCFLFCVLTGLVLTGLGAAQDTNFSLGPQYLITSGSPTFLQSIATPSLSLSAPPPSTSAPATEPLPEPSSPFAGAPPQPNLTRIFWGEPATAQQALENASEIEITSTEAPQPLPASIVDSGVTGMTSAQSLRMWGVGAPLGDTASFWKAHKPHASRLYTNADVQRLHPS